MMPSNVSSACSDIASSCGRPENKIFILHKASKHITDKEDLKLSSYSHGLLTFTCEKIISLEDKHRNLREQ